MLVYTKPTTTGLGTILASYLARHQVLVAVAPQPGSALFSSLSGHFSDRNRRRRYEMEVLGLLGFIFAIAALAKVRRLEARLKAAGVLEESV